MLNSTIKVQLYVGLENLHPTLLKRIMLNSTIKLQLSHL